MKQSATCSNFGPDDETERTGKVRSAWDIRRHVYSLALPKLLPWTVSMRRSALTQIICKCLCGTQTQLTPIRSRGRSGRVRAERLSAERLTLEIRRHPTPPNPDSGNQSHPMRRILLQARYRDTAFVLVTGLRFETNDLVRPDEHVLGPPLGIRRVSGNFVAYPCRQLPGDAEPFTCLKTRSEHGLLYLNTSGHQHIPSCMTFPSLQVAGIDL